MLTPMERFKFRAATVLWFLLTLFCLLSLPVLFDWGVSLVLGVLFAGAALGSLVFLIIWLFRKGKAGFDSKVVWLKSVAAGFYVLSFTVAFPVYYLATIVETSPFLLPQITITDGSKKIIFQGMLHVGSEDFYKAVIYDLETALFEGYHIYYEGVQPSPGEGDEWLAKNLGGGGDLSEGYRKLAEACGLRFQKDYFGVMEKDAKLRPQQHVIADVTSLDMKREAERLMRTDPKFATMNSPHPAKEGEGLGDLVSRLVDFQGKSSDSRKKISGILCRGVLSWVLGKSARTSPGEIKQPLGPVILDFRNRFLARKALEDSAKKIFVLYGANHFNGVFALLKAANPAWKVVSVKWLRGIRKPEKFEVELELR